MRQVGITSILVGWGVLVWAASSFFQPSFPTFERGQKIGTLSIPAVDIFVPIYEGVHENVLQKGVGHDERSAMPGEGNHVVLAGHRDTVFRRLADVKRHDALIVQTNRGTFTYYVQSIRIVDANDRTVIVPKAQPTLTLVTCYPFQFIGRAPQRYVIVARPPFAL